MYVNFAVRSEKGNIRENNEDNFFCNGVFMMPSEYEKKFFLNGASEIPCVVAVCDGMGGEDCGEIASLKTVETLAEHSEKIKNSSYNSYDEVYDFIKNANKKLISFAQEKNIRTGTTLALVVIKEEFFYVYNLGDSRIFRLEDGRLLRITDDHTVAEDKARMGIITPKQATKSKERNILTRYIGSKDDFTISPDSYGPFNFDENKMILLCSDGITDMLNYSEMSKAIAESKNPPEAVNNLVNAALENGGRDNLTCIAITLNSMIEPLTLKA